MASATLVRRGGFGLSSATVRNVLASLEEMGYVHQPHTSAGRVPTDLRLPLLRGPAARDRGGPGRASGVEAQLLAQAGSPALMGDALTTVSHVLSEASHHVGFAVPPQSDDAAFQRIDFVPLAETKVLVVVVMRGGHVSHKVVDIGEPLQMSDLHQAANYLNEEFAGLPLGEVRAAVRRADGRGADAVRRAALARAAARRVHVRGPREPQALFIEGAASLLEESDDGGRVSLGTLRTLLRMIEEKQRLVRLLDGVHRRPGPDGRHRHRAQRRRTCAPFSLVAHDLQRRRPHAARSASSARRACSTRAPSPSSTAPAAP